ncbi:alpha/beta hydrolase [Ginsengibacter hankyongi]|uniref:Alpha/beta hydrolase n=1 Tax=Ginsengibacter hankyongi TaxID=2607284 RepID=A0A5J5IJD1_9BACT|nr:dienelactone hydrolase family protein [Ginsengibacter hankyongi]KAA9040608.1 alpha/beta hydrolase [Ginsengibacter hankyongi]
MNYRFNSEVSITSNDNVILQGLLTIPEKAPAIIIFSHGSGSSRFSKRNRLVAEYLNGKNFGTLLFDLLTTEEDKFYDYRFNIELLTKRLASATGWLEKFPSAKDCRIGYFGASTGAASALAAAANLPQIGAVVSRGGRPDLAMDNLLRVEAPVLLIVGSLDTEVLELNKDAYRKLHCEKKLEVVDGATHLFEEPGTMDKVSKLAAAWFQKYLQPVKV